MKTVAIALAMLLVGSTPLLAQEFSFDEFVGVWEGTISSESFGGYNDPITLEVEPTGFYTDSSGHLMPTIYPNTQMCEFDSATNRVHFWYLQTVYAGMRFYQHFYFEVVEYTGNSLELHYNFWDDDVPHPQAGTISLVRTGVAPVGDEADDVPSRVASIAAYPNPFNPATRVAFELSTTESARLDIIDLRGRQVAVLHNGALTAGRHEFEWRGRDQRGRSVAGGVYIARLVTATDIRTLKLSLAK